MILDQVRTGGQQDAPAAVLAHQRTEHGRTARGRSTRVEPQLDQRFCRGSASRAWIASRMTPQERMGCPDQLSARTGPPQQAFRRRLIEPGHFLGTNGSPTGRAAGRQLVPRPPHPWPGCPPFPGQGQWTMWRFRRPVPGDLSRSAGRPPSDRSAADQPSVRCRPGIQAPADAGHALIHLAGQNVSSQPARKKNGARGPLRARTTSAMRLKLAAASRYCPACISSFARTRTG